MKIEFSKLILIVTYGSALVFTLVAAYLAAIGADVASFSTVVLANWALVTTGTSFYYWKAKAENLIKISKTVPQAVLDMIEKNHEEQ